MITGKDRSFLKGLSHSLQPLLQVGKHGLTDSFYAECDKILEDHELVKIAVLDSADMKAKDVANVIAERLGADFVSAVGKKLVIYRPSDTILPKDRIHLPKWRTKE